MRSVALLLLLANLALWAYMDLIAPRMKANAVAQQVQPERIRLIAGEDVPRQTAPRERAVECIEYGPLDDAKLALAKELAQTLQPDLAMAVRHAQGGGFLELRGPGEAVRKDLSRLLEDMTPRACEHLP